MMTMFAGRLSIVMFINETYCIAGGVFLDLAALAYIAQTVRKRQEQEDEDRLMHSTGKQMNEPAANIQALRDDGQTSSSPV
jgi:hypothetical protein